MAEVTLHLKAEGQRACLVCGADLGRRVSRWWLTNCWTADPNHYKAQQTCHPAEMARPCGLPASMNAPNDSDDMHAWASSSACAAAIRALAQQAEPPKEG